MEGKPTPCYNMQHLFFGDELDGRSESERQLREARAISICATCDLTLRCLERALVLGERAGVWGGMGESQRRRFRVHLKAEGYDQIPEGDDLYASWRAFMRLEAGMGDPNIKKCTTCGLSKNPQKDFYSIADGKFRAECKQCHNDKKRRRRKSA